MSQRKLSIPIAVPPVRFDTIDLRPVLEDYVEHEIGDEAQRYVRPEFEGKNGPFNLWEVRDEFFGWDPGCWQSFCVMCGRFSEKDQITKNEFFEWRDLLRAALERPAQEWPDLRTKFDPEKVAQLYVSFIEFFWDENRPGARLIGNTVLDYMIATIQVDKLTGTNFRHCARADCRAVFEPLTKRKIYCSWSCGHLVAVQNHRDRKAQALLDKAPKTSKKTTSAKRKETRK